MFKNFFSTFIIVGLAILIYYYGQEGVKLPNNSPISTTNQTKIPLDKQFDRMFKDSSVWNSYDVSPVKKIYKANDLNNINVSL
jgi:hypothetical protein